MKYNYTIPDISSLPDNAIEDLISIGDYLPELRLVRLSGIPVRIRISKDYVEINSTEDEIDLSAYNETFKKLMKFFYGIGYIFGYVFNNKLVVYDIYTNDNYFSSRDMNIIEFETGLPIVKPIIEGSFNFDYLVSIFNKKINDEKIPYNELFILPSVYINDNRSFSKNKPEIVSKVILGEKKVAPYNNYVYPYTKPKENTFVENSKEPEKEKKEVFVLTTKSERTEIFRETFKNVSDYFEKNKSTFDKNTLKWWDRFGKLSCYLYSIHTLPATRGIVYDYCKFYCLDSYGKYLTISEKWSELFLTFFEDYYNDMRFVKNLLEELSTYECFEKIFREELKTFDKFFVKETNTNNDWRYSYGNIYPEGY